MCFPDKGEFIKGHTAFKTKDPRDAVYNVATAFISCIWGDPIQMADGIGEFLLKWNKLFYRSDKNLDFDALERCIAANLQKLKGFRERDIFSLSNDDEDNIKYLFNEFLNASKISSGKRQGTKSPVSVAKALHVIAPSFFPLWDTAIARHYGCDYSKLPAKKYFLFCIKMKNMAKAVKNYVNKPPDKLLKLMDEYNFAKYTKGWI